jgi:hypothetical protein
MPTYITQSVTFGTTNTDNLSINSTTDVVVFGGGSNSPNFQLTGIAGGADGRLLMLQNSSGFDCFLEDHDSRSSGTNQFNGSGVVRSGKAVFVLYRGGLANKWFMVDSN